MRLNQTLNVEGLEAGKSYGLSLQAVNANTSAGANIGTGDQVADALGRLRFDVSTIYPEALTRAGHPCTVKLWIRPGGSPFNTPPVSPRYLLEQQVA